MKRRQRITTIALRIAAFRARRQGNDKLAQQIQQVIDSPRMMVAFDAAMQDEGDDDDVGFLEKILKWIVENPEQFKQLIAMLISMFAGVPI